MLRIAIAQLDPVVGAFESNVRKIQTAYKEACAQKARLLLTPELGVCGYPPLDLMDRPEIFERNEKALMELSALTQGQSCALAVGHVTLNPYSQGRRAHNTVSVLQDGVTVFKQSKTLLPTYDVFDEARYFEPSSVIELWNCDGLSVGFAICEDLWGRRMQLGRQLYSRDPIREYQEKKADLLLSISSSPYEWGKRATRETLHSQISAELGIPLIYVNQMGATDEILFDGGSFAVDSLGQCMGRLPFFQTAFAVIDIPLPESKGSKLKKGCWTQIEPKPVFSNEVEEIEILTQGLIVGIREYFKRTGFQKAILGLSGGIDSAVVATLAAHALGAANVRGVAMPSQYSSGHSLEDAEILARNLQISFQVQPIKFLFSIAAREVCPPGEVLKPIALENLQARLRGILLMAQANHFNSLVLTTGNKSELAVGYCTQYGDMVGALAPIGDILKTRVYELARHLNKAWGNSIPERTLTKAPSAELRPNQKDQDTLPPYELLDQILLEYLEKNTAVSTIEAKIQTQTGDKTWVREILRLLEVNEYKRRQGAPVLKVSSKAFGIGRRVPIAKRWDIH